MIELREKVLIAHKKKKFLVKVEEREFHTHFGVLNLKELLGKKYGEEVETHKGEKFRILKPSFVDYIKRMRRMPQIIQPKDAAQIVAVTGVSRGARVVEGGVGSGALTIFLASLVYPGTVTSYEVREDFAEIARKNVEGFGLENVEIKIKDICQGIDERDVDLVCLDIPKPENCVLSCFAALKYGGFVCSYSPTTEQVSRFVREAEKFFSDILVQECIVREWEWKKGLKPKTRMLGHTGFLTFGRKI